MTISSTRSDTASQVPRVSVITPTRNRAPLLSRAIDSVLGQTMPAWELLIVDDASTDGTPELVTARARQDGRVRAIRQESPAGAAAARNRAVRESRAALIAFLDDDDEWLPEKLELQLAALDAAAGDVGLVHSAFVEVDQDGRQRVAGSVDWMSRDPAATLPRANVLGHSTVVMRRSLFDEVGGFDERLPRLQDWDLWIRAARRGGFVCVPAALARIHVTTGSITSDAAALGSASEIIAAKFSDSGDLPRPARADLHYALAQLLMRHGLVREARVLLRRSLRLRPWPPPRVLLASLALLDPRLYRLALRAHARFARAA